MRVFRHAENAWARDSTAFDGLGPDGCQWRPPPDPEARPSMLAFALSALLAVLAGAGLVLQQILNANLRAGLDSASWAGVSSYAVGLACMALLAAALRDPVPTAGVAERIPWWTWSGGLFGAVFIGLAILLVPKLGAATFFALLVTGQMLASVLFYHAGLLGLAQRPVDLPRLLGIALLIGGVVLIRR